ncbi:hypothetical protein ACG33_07950 [Steroidobacter denitrificans]|uniref:Putative NAD(P)H nitroreductase n=1 Tax=Steroidobacter denitrificans TaxID=465721 RepID=A0A127FBT3_STEDE|nr:nitroreductase [Steroidobacter denitrificans]AMN47029.1 hypothetical protein ACG33_07950 [Steroidobacter denitrificans]
MDLPTAIESRTSAFKLKAPAPTRAQVEQIIRAGIRAPDHGRLRPWRFVVLEEQGRAKFGDAVVQLLREKNPDIAPERLETERTRLLHTPLIIVVAAKITKTRVPEIEQVCAVSAAVQNMLLTAHAMGLGAMWKTGPAAHDAGVKQVLGLAPEDHIVAFLHLGAIETPGPLVTAPEDGITTWI